MAKEYEMKERPVVKDFAGNIMESPMEILDNPVIQALSLFAGGVGKVPKVTGNVARKLHGLFKGDDYAKQSKQLADFLKTYTQSKHNTGLINKVKRKTKWFEEQHGVAKKADDSINELIRQNNLKEITKSLPNISRKFTPNVASRLDRATPTSTQIVDMLFDDSLRAANLSLGIPTAGLVGAQIGSNIDRKNPLIYKIAEMLMPDPILNIEMPERI